MCIRDRVQGVRQVIPDCPVTLDDLILWNGYEELTGSWFPNAAPELYDSLDVQHGIRHAGGRTLKRFSSGAGDHCSACLLYTSRCV